MGEWQRADSAGLQAAHTDPAAGGAVRGIQGRRGVGQPKAGVPASPRILPPVELPASVERLAAMAAARMGWQGTVLPEMTLLGRRVIAVARLDTVAHAERICLGMPPVLDRTTVSTWTWQEFAATAPPPAAELVGVLGVARHWRTGLASAAPFARYCETGVVLPWSVAMTQDYLVGCLPRARRYGISVITADPDGDVNLDQIGRREIIPTEPSAFTRWVNEQVYQRLLDVLDATE